jgi:hypothetical protein
MNIRIVGLWITGLITGIFLMVVDEILSLALYCGVTCQYAIPGSRNVQSLGELGTRFRLSRPKRLGVPRNHR